MKTYKIIYHNCITHETQHLRPTVEATWIDEKQKFLRDIYHFDRFERLEINGRLILNASRDAKPRMIPRAVQFILVPMQ